MFNIVIFSVVSLMAILIVKKHNPEIAVIISAGAGAIALLFIFGWVKEPLSELIKRLEEYGANSALTEYLLKVFGICYVTKFASELCTDFGQTSLSGKIDLAGRCTVFLLSVPLFDKIFEIVAALIN